VARQGIVLALSGFYCVLGASPVPALDRGADGKFSKRDSSHFVLFQDVDIDETAGLRGSRRFEQDILEALEGAYDRADDLLGLRPQRTITVVVYDPTVFDAEFAGLLKFPAAGFYGGRVHVRGGDRVSAHLIRVLNHEHVHAAFDAEAPRLILPGWFNEGIAEWFEASAGGGSGLTRWESHALAAAAGQGQLFSLAQLSGRSFAQMGPGAARLAYAQSHGFIHFLVRTYGARRLKEWVSSTLRGGDLDRATRRVYRSDLSTLEERFRASWRSPPR